MSKLLSTNSLNSMKFEQLVKNSHMNDEIHVESVQGPIDATVTTPKLSKDQMADAAAEYHSYRPSIHATTHSLAGATGALIAMALVYPLDNLRTRLQISKRETNLSIVAALEEILRVEGVKGLFAGLRSALVGVGASWALYYYFYALFKQYLNQKMLGGKNEALINLGVAMSSGVISAVFTNPIWVVNTRMKVRSSDQSLISQLITIAKDEGISTWFSGLTASLILVINPAIQFAVYEKLKALLLSYHENKARRTQLASGKNLMHQAVTSRLMFSTDPIKTTPQVELSSSSIFLIGAFAKLISTLVTYPYQVVKSRLHVNKKNKFYGGIIDCFIKIIEQEGLSGLFRGIQSKILVTTFTSAIMFASYEFILGILYAIHLKVNAIKSKRLA